MAHLLAQVFGNLLQNAAKYTPDGGSVAIAATVEDGRAVVRVRDTGSGIPRDQLGAIFELFSSPPPRCHGGVAPFRSRTAHCCAAGDFGLISNNNLPAGHAGSHA